MTRQEIRLKARAMQYNLASGGRGPEADIYQIELDLREVVRATLEEAARADCVLCGRGIQLSEHADMGGFWWHTDDYRRDTCDASGIHDLIAAMESEVKGE